MTKYKVKYKVEKIFNVEVEIDNPPKSSEELSDSIYDLIIEDYEVGNMNNEEADESYSIEKIEELND
jgi:hypothetical protein